MLAIVAGVAVGTAESAIPKASANATAKCTKVDTANAAANSGESCYTLESAEAVRVYGSWLAEFMH